jgi:hypothetical protein
MFNRKEYRRKYYLEHKKDENIKSIIYGDSNKERHNLVVKEWRYKNRKHLTEYRSSRYQKNKQSEKDGVKNWRDRNREKVRLLVKKYPEKYKARYLVGNAIKLGKLKRLPCEICGNLKVEGHHPDYAKPLEVKWLCKLHHDLTHKSMETDETTVATPAEEPTENVEETESVETTETPTE